MFYIERRQKYHVIAYMLWSSTFFIRLPQTQILITKSWNIHSIIPSVQHWFTLLPFLVGIVMNQWNFYGCISMNKMFLKHESSIRCHLCSKKILAPWLQSIFLFHYHFPLGFSLQRHSSPHCHYCRLIYSMKYASVNTSIHILLN